MQVRYQSRQAKREDAWYSHPVVDRGCSWEGSALFTALYLYQVIVADLLKQCHILPTCQ